MSLLTRLTAARRAGKLKHARGLAPHELEALQGRLAEAGSGAVPSLLDMPGTRRGARSRARCSGADPRRGLAAALPGGARLAQSGGGFRCGEGAGAQRPTTIRSRSCRSFKTRATSKRTLESHPVARASSLSSARLLALFPEQGGETRGVVARLLDATVDGAAVPDLVRALENPQWWVRAAGGAPPRAFSGERRGYGARIGDEHRSVRLEVVQGLRLARARSEMPALLTALRDRDLKVQTAAIDAVVALGDASTVPSLLGSAQPTKANTYGERRWKC